MSTTRAEHRHVATSGASDDDRPEPSTGQRPTTPGRHPSRRAVRASVAAIALSLGAAALYVASDATADGPPVHECSQTAPAGAASDTGCDGLWDRILVLGLPEHEWAPAAQDMGLILRDGWISDDGLRWEHLDGRSYTVATPQRSDGRQASGS